MKGNVTNTGYWPDSPDRNNDFNIIPSNNITMEGMDMPLIGVSNTGDKKLMLPGKNYKFKGEHVTEFPIQGFNENTDWLGSKYRDIGVSASGNNFEVGLGNYMPYDTPTKEGMVNPYAYGSVNISKNRSLGINLSPDYMGMSFKKEFNKGGIYLGAYKQVGGQLVPHDTNMSSFQKGGEPIYVYSKDDPQYIQYLKDLEHYNKNKAIYEEAGKYNRSAPPGESDYAFATYDDYVDKAYKLAKDHNYYIDPHLGEPDSYYTAPPLAGGKKIDYYLFRKPTPVILEKESKPKAIDIKPLPMQQVDLKSGLTRLPIPQTNKQRVVVNTPQGDKIRVQDAKTKRFINWEDEKGLPSDVENPSGTASQDFPEMRRVAVPPGGFAYGGDISIPNLSRQDGGGIEAMFKQIIPNYGSKPSLFEEIASMPAEISHIVKSRSYEPSEAYIQELMRQENESNTGFRNNRYYPYDSVEGGTPTIGYGHKLTQQEVNSNKYAAGLTKADVEKLMRDDLSKHKDIARSAFENEYGKGTFNRLPDSLKDIVVDYSYTGTGIDKFPNFHKAVYEYSATKDPVLKQAAYDKMLAQYKRYTGKKELKKRNTYTEQVLRGLKQEGGSNFKTKLNPQEEQQFKQFYQTLPGNLREDNSSYDTRGYWDALGKPSEFDYSQPTEEDGYYHAFSRHPETGKILKSPGHPTFKYAVDKTPIEGNIYVPTVGVDGNVYMRDLNQDAESLQRQKGGPAERFNTKLRGQAAEAFNQHAQQFPSLINDAYDYDTRGFYKELYNANNGDINKITEALTPGSETAHVGTDRYKKPNHPTFSKESKYYVPILRPAGEWGHNQAGDYFDASRRNIRNMRESDGTPLEYFKRAEDYNQNGIPDVNMYYRGKTMFDTETTPAGTPQPKLNRSTFAEGGSVKRVKIKSLPKNWKSQ